MALLNSLHAKQQLANPNAPLHDGISLEGIQTERKAAQRRTVDPAGPYVRLLGSRMYERSPSRAHAVQPTAAGSLEALPPAGSCHQPASNFNIRFAHASMSKAKASITSIVWTPEGRRCIIGSQRGEFTIWGGTTFTYDTALQGHEAAIRCMQFTHHANFFLTVDDGGRLKYWRTNYELLKDERAHQEGACAVTLAPSDLKFATCSNDSTVKERFFQLNSQVWDFASCTAERVLTGHGGDVKSADWHPQHSIIASGSKDSLVKIWDPKSSSDSALATLHGHNNSVSTVQWNANGNWLLTAGRDQTCKVWDLRMLKELGSYKGHVRDVMCAAWHPVHEELFCSGSQDGTIMYWLISRSAPQAEVVGAHEGSINAMAWHPVGHVLATGSNDLMTRFWARPKAEEGREHGAARQDKAAVPEGDVPQRMMPVATSTSIPGIGQAFVASTAAFRSQTSTQPQPGKRPASAGAPSASSEGNGQKRRPDTGASAQPHKRPR